MKKKIVSALLCVAMAASLVVGCGSKSGSDSTVVNLSILEKFQNSFSPDFIGI